MKKLLVIFGGPNGCGKSSLYEALRARKGTLPFLNADMIAVATKGIPGSRGEVEAGRIMLTQLKDAIAQGRSVSFETTLSGRLWEPLIKPAHAQGYYVIIVFVSLDSVELSLQRIEARIRSGGHPIPAETVRRRWPRAHANFWCRYREMVDAWYLFDNSKKGAVLAAQNIEGRKKILHPDVIKRVESYGKKSRA
jgi:predicted ABC-type ATPase